MVTVISTFAGCGGSSLGYRLAGYKELLAIDYDKAAVETFRLNFPEIPIWDKDIYSISSQEILMFCNLEKGELDILDGSPPCQGFSLAGKMNITDSRNNLYKEFTRLLLGLQPKVFVMENVGSLVKGRMKGIFKDIMNSLEACGYNVKCRLMNTMYYGVPQRRQRLIWIGVRKDLNISPSYPKPFAYPITVREAFIGLPIQYQEKELPEREKKLWKRTKKGNNLSQAAVRLFNQKNCNFTHCRLDWNSPSPTICTVRDILHPDECRSLTIAELKRLSSFPDDFQFIGSFCQQWKVIGNAVPPLLIKAIAKHIKSEILKDNNG